MLPWPYQSDLGTSGMNPLLELGIRPRPIEDAWGYTVRQAMALHIGAHEDGWVLARPERSLLVLGPPRDTGKTTSVLVPTVLVTFAPSPRWLRPAPKTTSSPRRPRPER